MPAPTRVYTDAEFDDPHFGDAPGATPSTRADQAISALAHVSSLLGLGIVAPALIYLIKKDASAFVADHAREALNFHLTVLLAVVASAVLIVVGIGIVLLPVVIVGSTVLSIVGTIRANDGEAYRYPFTLRLV